MKAKMLNALLLSGCFMFLVVAGSHGEDLMIEAKENWNAEDIPYPNSPVGGYGGGPSGGVILNPAMKNFNDYLSKNGFDEIGILGVCGGTFRWSFNKNLQIGMSGGDFFGESITRHKDGDKEFIKEVIIEGGGGVIQAVYRIPYKRWAIGIGGGIGGFGGTFSTIVTDTKGSPVEYKSFRGGGPMVQFLVEGTYYVAPILGIGVEVSYISAKTRELEWGDIESDEPEEVDLSGLMVTIGTRFHF